MTKNTWIWIGLGLLAVLSLRIYYLQEMVAALIVFSFLFVAVSLAALAMFLLVRASRPIMAWAFPTVGRLVRRGAEAVEGVITSSVGGVCAPSSEESTSEMERELQSHLLAIRGPCTKPHLQDSYASAGRSANHRLVQTEEAVKTSWKLVDANSELFKLDPHQI